MAKTRKKYRAVREKIGTRLDCSIGSFILSNGLPQTKLKKLHDIYGDKFVTYDSTAD